jgi:PDZ domain
MRCILREDAMLRPLLALAAIAVFTLSTAATVAAQPKGGGGGGKGGGPGFGGPKVGGPGIGIGVGGPGWGAYWNTGPYWGGGYAPYYWDGGRYSYYAPGYYYSSPGYYYTMPRYYYTSPTYRYVVPASATEVDNTQYGMQITQVFDGGARKASLRSGDIILGVGNARVQSFEALQAALAGAKEVEISFLNGGTRKVEKVPVQVVDNRIGVEVVAVPVQ